ncbi:MAG TPA: hypothetical protein VN282_07765 [Pyrinomonadaceae bacterium]|nr:hypothetical protein [Pyrinomonadaceae bacterium]
MSPLKSILVGPRRRPRGLLSFGVAACAVLVLTPSFLAAAQAPAGVRAVSDGDVRKAEKLLAKLRLLHEAAEAGDAGAYRKLASKMYPDLFVKAAELRPGDLSTDLSTAVFLAEELGSARAAGVVTAADCRRERPDIYRPLCLGLRDGTVRGLLLAKSRLHARWAEAVVKSQRGEADALSESALREMAAARANDSLLAARVMETLRQLEGFSPAAAPDVSRVGRPATAAAGFAGADGEFAEALRITGVLLAWMPRGQTFYRLSGARQAYADGLSWRYKVSEAQSLVVSANSFTPDPLKVIDLDAGQAAAAASANWKSAARLTRLTEQSLLKEARRR